MTEVDLQSDLPPGWVWTTLAEVSNTSRSRRNPQDYPSLPFIGLEHVEAHTTRLLGTVPANEMRSAAEYFQPGDVLYSRLRPYLNKVYCPDFEGLCSSEFIIFRKQTEIESLYILYFLFSWDFVSFATHLNTGDRPRVDFEQLASYPFPLAPLAEQQRIVEAIESQFTRLDAGVAALKRLRANLKRYKAAVLKAACEGNLVEQDPDDEPASELLERILKERRAKWAAEQRAKGKDPRKLTYKEPVAPDTADLPDLPEGWVWATIGQAFEVFVGSTPSRKRSEYWDGDIPWVSSGEVAFCRIRNTCEYITKLGLENTSTEVHPIGTILLGMIGEGKTRGQAAILDIPASHNQNSAAIRVSEAGLPPEYLYYFLESTYEQTRRGSSGNNQPALNKSRVQAIIFPLPPVYEQNRIATEIDRLLSVFDDLVDTVDDGLKRAERLRQSILREAFAGRLVPQDPDDEPAGELLKRIRRDRARQTNGKKRR